MPTPVSKADVDKNLEKQIGELIRLSSEQFIEGVRGGPAPWAFPLLNGWDGNLFDFVGMSDPFDRTQSRQQYKEAVKDPDNPGTAGDLTATSLMADYLAVMERAFRARHTMRRPRALLHAMGRKKGHGRDTGPLFETGVEFFRRLLREAKAS